MRDIREFWCLWSEETQGWYLVLLGHFPVGPYPSAGATVISAHGMTGRSEAEFECTEDHGTMYHYEADDEHWTQQPGQPEPVDLVAMCAGLDDKILKLNGETYRCKCGCNVFRNPAPTQYVCNSCRAIFTAE